MLYLKHGIILPEGLTTRDFNIETDIEYFDIKTGKKVGFPANFILMSDEDKQKWADSVQAKHKLCH